MKTLSYYKNRGNEEIKEGHEYYLGELLEDVTYELEQELKESNELEQLGVIVYYDEETNKQYLIDFNFKDYVDNDLLDCIVTIVNINLY